MRKQKKKTAKKMQEKQLGKISGGSGLSGTRKLVSRKSVQKATQGAVKSAGRAAGGVAVGAAKGAAKGAKKVFKKIF